MDAECYLENHGINSQSVRIKKLESFRATYEFDQALPVLAAADRRGIREKESERSDYKDETIAGENKKTTNKTTTVRWGLQNIFFSLLFWVGENEEMRIRKMTRTI